MPVPNQTEPKEQPRPPGGHATFAGDQWRCHFRGRPGEAQRRARIERPGVRVLPVGEAFSVLRLSAQASDTQLRLVSGNLVRQATAHPKAPAPETPQSR